MRPLRNSLIPWLLTVAMSSSVVSGCGNAPATSSDVPPQAVSQRPESDNFPLAVGNSWSYRCSTEGEFQFEKTLAVESETAVDGTTFFKVGLSRDGGGPPLNYYMFVDRDRTVFKAPAASRDAAEPVVKQSMRIGDRVGDFVAAAAEKTTTPATNEVEVLRVENFDHEDPAASAEKRMEWLGWSYAAGIGPVVEADGLGSECVLARFHVQKPR